MVTERDTDPGGREVWALICVCAYKLSDLSPESTSVNRG